MDNLSYPQPLNGWLRSCHRRCSHLFFIGTFLMGIGILAVLFHISNTATIAIAATPPPPRPSTAAAAASIEHERVKRQTNQNSHKELLQHKPSTSDLTVVTASRITSTSTSRYPSIRNENVNAIDINNERWSVAKRGQSHSADHQSHAERYQQHAAHRLRHKYDDPASNEYPNRHRYISLNNRNHVNDDDDGNGAGSSNRRGHLPKINRSRDGNGNNDGDDDGSSNSRPSGSSRNRNNNFSLRSNITSHYKVHAYAMANSSSTYGVDDVMMKRPLPLSSAPLLMHRHSQFTNVKHANATISSSSPSSATSSSSLRPSQNHMIVRGNNKHKNDGYVVLRKYKCIMCKVIPGEPMRRPSQSYNNNEQWNRGMCTATV